MSNAIFVPNLKKKIIMTKKNVLIFVIFQVFIQKFPIIVLLPRQPNSPTTLIDSYLQCFAISLVTSQIPTSLLLTLTRYLRKTTAGHFDALGYSRVKKGLETIL